MQPEVDLRPFEDPSSPALLPIRGEKGERIGGTKRPLALRTGPGALWAAGGVRVIAGRTSFRYLPGFPVRLRQNCLTFSSHADNVRLAIGLPCRGVAQLLLNIT